MNEAAQESAGGQDDSRSSEHPSVHETYAGHSTSGDGEVVGLTLDDSQIRRQPNRLLHCRGIEPAVGLGAGAAHRGSLAAVEQPKLNPGGVSHAPH